MKIAYFILGLNGAGKSTLRDMLDFENVTIIDPDKIKREYNCSEIEAGKRAIHLFNGCMTNKLSCLVESTLTSKSIFEQIKKAKQNNYFIRCVYIGLSSVNKHMLRVASRVQNGGHHIPTEIIKRRHTISYENINKLFTLADSLTIYDNTKQYNKQVELIDNKIEYAKELKNWVKEYVL